MRTPSAEELTRKWEEAPWFRPYNPSKPHEYDSLNLRLRRVISWLGRAEAAKGSDDADAWFMFHWIAFNAMYGRLGISSTDEPGTKKPGEKKLWCEYFERLEKINPVADPESVSTGIKDPESVIYGIIWSVLRDEIEAMLTNKYVFEPFWTDYNNQAKSLTWKQKFQRAQKRMKEDLRKA